MGRSDAEKPKEARKPQNAELYDEKSPYSPNKENKPVESRSASGKELARKSSFQRLSRRLSKQISREMIRRSSSIIETLPETPAGWTVLLSSLCSVALGYELQLQKSLTCPPLVYGETREGPMKPIFEKMTETSASILSRDIQPSLLVGTRKVLASIVAAIPGGPSLTDDHIHFRQILTMCQDGATIAVDWELPVIPNDNNVQKRKNEIINGLIRQPVVLIMHGMANDSSFWYVRSLMRTCTDRGWVAVGMNMRGCGGIPLATPRGYNGAYTGDLRSIVHHISGRLAKDVPLFLVGYSLGANLVSKYLGEEGLNGTLPKCIAGGVSSGNPLQLDANSMRTPWKQALAIGAKKTMLEHFNSFRKMNTSQYRAAFFKAMTAPTIGDFDNAIASTFIRNEPYYPYSVKVGFTSGEEYWMDGSSYRLIRSVSVPLLQLIAGDDFIVSKSFKRKLTYLIMNPNVMTVETQCGGHLGWQESAPEHSSFGPGTSWADRATADFFEAILKGKGTENKNNTTRHGSDKRENDVFSITEKLKRTNPDTNFSGIKSRL